MQSTNNLVHMSKLVHGNWFLDYAVAILGIFHAKEM